MSGRPLPGRAQRSGRAMTGPLGEGRRRERTHRILGTGGRGMTTMTRRELLKASTAAGLVLGAPAIARAQSREPIPIGTLCPLTGAGGSYGPDMQRAVVAVAERVNSSGGIQGRPIQLFHE